MSVDRIHGDVQFVCDTNCGEFFDSGTGHFETALIMVKREGWYIMRSDNEWKHYCTDCAKQVR